MQFKSILIVGAALSVYTGVFAEIKITSEGIYTDKKTGLTLVYGKAEVPSWYWGFEVMDKGPVVQLYAFPVPDEAVDPGEIDPYSPRTFYVAGLLRDKAARTVTCMASESPAHGEGEESVVWDLSAAKPVTDEKGQAVLKAWARSRAMTLFMFADESMSSPMFTVLSETMESIYGADDFFLPTMRRRSLGDDEFAMGLMSVMGGQVAIRATLQTQTLDGENGDSGINAEPGVEVSTIEAVSVKSHPYAEMKAALKAEPVTSLADYVPEDRLCVLVREPGRIADLFEGADAALTRLSPLIGNSFVDYALLTRYAAKFGLTPEQVKQWFSGGNVEELAVFAPDVFFRDNTDITFVIRFKPKSWTPFLLKEDSKDILTVPLLGSGGSFHVTVRGGLLFASTNKNELQLALRLADGKGKGSLGQTDEFCVMNSKLPVTDETRAYVYFSDPFLRRLTGPEIKIGQLRRALARAKMEWISTVALLYRLDHGQDAPDLATLKTRGYLTEEQAPASEYALEAGCRVISKTWGALDSLKTLTEHPVTLATKSEEAAYDEYRERYTHFWREYFDPIALRLDAPKDGTLTLETFILPLIDSSIYNDMQAWFIGEDGEDASVKPLLMPQYSKEPVASLAMNANFSKLDGVYYFSRELQLWGVEDLLAALDDQVVLSLQDSDPVLQTAFPALNTLGERNFLGFGGEEMFLFPVVSSLLTRPCDLAVRIREGQEATVRKMLRTLLISRTEEWFSMESVFIPDSKTVLVSWTVLGIARIEYAVTVENGWLHISNHPWTPVLIAGSKPIGEAHAGVNLALSEMKSGLPQALSAAQSKFRKSVYASGSQLIPWMMAYAVDAPAAARMQQAALGYATPVPEAVSIDIRQFTTKPYGSWVSQEEPTLQFSDNGMFSGIQNMQLWFRFEDDGLRSRVTFLPQKGNAN